MRRSPAQRSQAAADGKLNGWRPSSRVEMRTTFIGEIHYEVIEGKEIEEGKGVEERGTA